MECGIIYILILGCIGGDYYDKETSQQETDLDDPLMFSDEDLYYIENPVMSDYEFNLKNKGFKIYSSYDAGNFDDLQSQAKYLEEKNIDFYIGDAHNIKGDKLKRSFALYIKDDANKEIIDNLPRFQFKTTEEMANRACENYEKYKDVKTIEDLGITINPNVLERIEILKLFDKKDGLNKLEYMIAYKEAVGVFDNIEQFYCSFCEYIKNCNNEMIKVSVESFKDSLNKAQ